MPTPTAAAETRLRRIVSASDRFVGVLKTVRKSGLRDLVWDSIGGTFDPARVRDVDVACFDSEHLQRVRDDEADALLRQLDQSVPWEAKNQAAVHLWYPDKFDGTAYFPATSVLDAVSRWPEMARSVAHRLNDHGRLEIFALCGLRDLLDGVWRRNPAQVSIERSRHRLRPQCVPEP